MILCGLTDGQNFFFQLLTPTSMTASQDAHFGEIVDFITFQIPMGGENKMVVMTASQDQMIRGFTFENNQFIK